MSRIEYGPDVNLQELRSELAKRVATLVIFTAYIAAVLVMFPVLNRGRYPLNELFVVGILLLVGLGAQILSNFRPHLARRLLVWGLTATLLVAMTILPDPWLPFAELMLSFISALLVSGGGFITTILVGGLAAWLAQSGARAYPLPILGAALTLSALLAWLVTRTMYTALGWAWTMQQRSDHLLELARDRQGELNNALKSLDIANAILRRTQRELITARKQAEEARLMKEQFAANVSHELRTPLNLIIGFSELMYISPEVYGDMIWSPTLRRDIYQIYRNSKHLLEMIDDVLDLSRFEIVGFTLNREPTPLTPLLRETVDIAANLFTGQPVRLETEIAADLPTLEIDRTRIRQVLLNLLSNAARFTEEGVVRVEARTTDGKVMIAVHDTGPGIPSDKLPHLFDEFYQVDRSLHRKHGGTGLGLAISKRFVEAHNGHIWVESEEGVGSTFTVTLPIPGEYLPPSPTRLSRPVELSPSGAAPSILVVDPDPAVADLVRRHFEDYEVIHVDNADRLSEAILFHHPHAVVYNVPPRERVYDDHLPPLSVPFVECSLPSQAWVADDLAVRACLTKPVSAQQLLEEVERLGNVHDVVVVDDDRGFCQLVERMFESTGQQFTVRRAYGGTDGLAAIRARRPDLLLLDLIMPDLDGFQVLEAMRREPELASIPVILLTATTLAEDALEQRGSQVVIHRPDGLKLAEVLRCLHAVIGVLEPHYDERGVPAEIFTTPPTDGVPPTPPLD